MSIKNDKVNSCVVVLLFLATCGVAFGLPFMLSGVTAAERHQAKLIIPTGEGYVTATRSTERVLTIEAFATLFFSPTVAPTTTFTNFPTATQSFTQTSISFTHTFTSLPTFTAETIPVVTIRPSFTFTPTKISHPGQSPTPIPSNTPEPPTKIVTATVSKTPIPSVTYTLVPTLTFTPKPPPTNTPEPPPTNTSEPPPTDTPETPTEPPPAETALP